MKYPIHPDLKKYEKMRTPITPRLLPLINGVVERSYNKRPPEPGVTEKRMSIPGYRDEAIDVLIYEPENANQPLPCLMYFHGGAFVLKPASFHKGSICEYVLNTPCKVIFVDYRLAPEYPFPVGLEDCYKAFEWAYRNAQALGIVKEKIAVGGDSAGGALAAGVSLMARDRKGPDILFQMLIYPVTDARLMTDSMKAFTDTPLWNAKQNEKMWQLYLGETSSKSRAYASPIEAETHENLPAAYIEVAEFDCLRDEGILYAETLKKNGVSVELNQPQGTIHGFEVAEGSGIVRDSLNRRIAALKRAFDEC